MLDAVALATQAPALGLPDLYAFFALWADDFTTGAPAIETPAIVRIRQGDLVYASIELIPVLAAAAALQTALDADRDLNPRFVADIGARLPLEGGVSIHPAVAGHREVDDES
jgi:hypothetical protein